MMDDYTEIKELNYQDIDKITKLHQKSLPNDILPILGNNILRKYYISVLKYRNKKFFLYGIFDNSENLIGCIQISLKSFSLNSLLGLDTLIEIIIKLIRKPKFALNCMIQYINYSNIKNDEIEISFIFVSPHTRNNGIGKKLVYHAVNESKKFGKYKLITKTSNLAWSKFYKRNFNAKVLKRFKTFDSMYENLSFNTDL